MGHLCGLVVHCKRTKVSFLSYSRVISDNIQRHFSPHSRLTTLDCQSYISFLVNSIRNSVYITETLDNSGRAFYILLQENTVSIYIIHTHILDTHTQTHIYTYVYRVFMCVYRHVQNDVKTICNTCRDDYHTCRICITCMQLTLKVFYPFF